jgi:hypothetical protein
MKGAANVGGHGTRRRDTHFLGRLDETILELR